MCPWDITYLPSCAFHIPCPSKALLMKTSKPFSEYRMMEKECGRPSPHPKGGFHVRRNVMNGEMSAEPASSSSFSTSDSLPLLRLLFQPRQQDPLRPTTQCWKSVKRQNQVECCSQKNPRKVITNSQQIRLTYEFFLSFTRVVTSQTKDLQDKYSEHAQGEFNPSLIFRHQVRCDQNE